MRDDRQADPEPARDYRHDDVGVEARRLHKRAVLSRLKEEGAGVHVTGVDWLGLGGGGTGRADVFSCPVCWVVGGCLAASFSFLAFCVQSGQVISLAFAD